jgi:hypothetical protein
MSNAGNVTVDMTRVMRDVTITVRVAGGGRWTVRLWIAAQLFRLGAALAGTKLELELRP